MSSQLWELDFSEAGLGFVFPFFFVLRRLYLIYNTLSLGLTVGWSCGSSFLLVRDPPTANIIVVDCSGLIAAARPHLIQELHKAMLPVQLVPQLMDERPDVSLRGARGDAHLIGPVFGVVIKHDR